MNISIMPVTRDVSKFTGWLNPFASCAYDVGRGAGRVAGRRIGGAATAHAACKEKLD